MNEKWKVQLISSENLAVLIIDALVHGQCINRKDFESAIATAKKSIDSRKVMGDYHLGLDSDELGMLLVNDLIREEKISQDKFEKAVSIAEDEIIARKAMDDY